MKKDWRDLEDDLINTIQNCLRTLKDKEKAMEYFNGTTIVELINDAVSDEELK